MLASVGDEAREVISSFDEYLTWEALVIRFLQHCGPPDILAEVYSMLEDAHIEEVEQTLQQRVQKLTMCWIRAQATYHGVFPKTGHHYCNSTDRRYQDNPAILLQHILGLHSEARRTPVKLPPQTLLRTGPALSTHVSLLPGTVP